MGSCCAKPVEAIVGSYAFAPQEPTYTKDQVALWIETSSGTKLPAFHIDRGEDLTLLVSHSNAEDLGTVLERWDALSRELRVNVFAYEYSGYGQSDGAPPSVASLRRDAEAAFRMLVDVFKLTPESDIVLHGTSIGSYPTCFLASRHAVRGVIICSGFASAARLTSFGSLLRFADSLALDNLSLLKQSVSPVQIVHGSADKMVPVSNGQALHAASSVKGNHPCPPAWIEGATHNNMYDVESGIAKAHTASLRAFREHLLANPPEKKAPD